MTEILLIALFFFAFLIFAEFLGRLAYRLYYGVPFHDRRIAEYPYSRFLQEMPPPLYCVFKKGFRSPQVNINRFGLRGKEPAPNGAKRRLLVVGESPFFGPKLRDESRIWATQLERILARSGHGDWEVINGGTPVYASAQHWHFWKEALDRVNPQIIVVAFGGNDATQMSVLGENWHPEAHWPFEFLLKLERKGTWWNSFLSRFCLYFLLRRAFEGHVPPSFARGEGSLPWEACRQNVMNQYKNFHDYAQSKGKRIAFANTFFVFNRQVTAREERCLFSIQSNYRVSIEHDGPYFFELIDAVSGNLCPTLGVPYLDLKADFDAYPRRFECWYDLAHWNEKGMTFIAKALYKRIDQLGWWN